MNTYFQPDKAPIGTPERDLSDEVLAVLQAEAEASGRESVYTWFREYYLNEGIGLAPYDVAIADFALRKLQDCNFLEVGAGMAQLSALLAVRGFRTVGMEGHPAIFKTTTTVHSRVCRRFAGVADRFSVLNTRFPNQAAELVDGDTVIAAINISHQLTSKEFDDILVAFKLARGVIINVAGFFRPRVDAEAQAELIGQFKARGFAEPQVIYSWQHGEYRFQPGQILYFQNSAMIGDS